MARSRLAVPFGGSAAIGRACAPSFDPPSKVQSFRVLAVQKDKPYAKPGETVNFSMLYDDASPSAPRPIHIAWLPGSRILSADSNTSARSFQNPNCRRGEPEKSARHQLPWGASGGVLTRPRAKLPDRDRHAPCRAHVPVRAGARVLVPISDNIISVPREASGPEPDPLRRGQFVFFVACAGDHIALTRATSGSTEGTVPTFPIGCFTKDNVPLGADDFVAGYSEVFAYDKIT